MAANEDLVIEGQTEGSIRHGSSLTIGEEGTTFSGSIEMRSPSE